MTSTFLHEDKAIPADEVVDTEAPNCDACAQRMWLGRVETKINDSGITCKKEFECKLCGLSRIVVSRRPAGTTAVA
jgi:hypothetical protein